MRLDAMAPDERFEVTGMPELKGTVLHVGTAGVRVQYDGVETTSFEAKSKWGKDEQPKKVTITTHRESCLISGGTEVTRL